MKTKKSPKQQVFNIKKLKTKKLKLKVKSEQIAENDQLKQLAEDLEKDATQLIKRIQKQNSKDLSYKPIDILEDKVYQQHEFLRGLEEVQFCNFSQMLSVIESAFQALREKEIYLKEFSHQEKVFREATGLL